MTRHKGANSSQARPLLGHQGHPKSAPRPVSSESTRVSLKLYGTQVTCPSESCQHSCLGTAGCHRGRTLRRVTWQLLGPQDLFHPLGPTFHHPHRPRPGPSAHHTLASGLLAMLLPGVCSSLPNPGLPPGPSPTPLQPRSASQYHITPPCEPQNHGGRCHPHWTDPRLGKVRQSTWATLLETGTPAPTPFHSGSSPAHCHLTQRGPSGNQATGTR